MDDLLAKLESAECGSRELDLEIALATEDVRCERMTEYPTRYWAYREWSEEIAPGKKIVHERMGVTAPHYTTSLDAALTLVPEGCEWELADDAQWEARIPARARVWRVGQKSPKNTQAETPVLALCIAALKAMKAEEKAP